MLLTVALLLICGASAVASEENSEKMKVIFDTDNGVFGDDTKALFTVLGCGVSHYLPPSPRNPHTKTNSTTI